MATWSPNKARRPSPRAAEALLLFLLASAGANLKADWKTIGGRFDKAGATGRSRRQIDVAGAAGLNLRFILHGSTAQDEARDKFWVCGAVASGQPAGQRNTLVLSFRSKDQDLLITTAPDFIFSQTMAKASQFLSGFKRQGRVPAVVDYVAAGSRFRSVESIS